MSKSSNHTENTSFKKPTESSVPFSNKVPNLRRADPNDIYGINAKKSCATCRWFHSEPLAAPGGWCHKFPSQQMNCGVGDVCDKWEVRGPINSAFTEREILSHIIDGAAGVQVVLPRMQGKKITIDTLTYKTQVAAMMSSLGCKDKEYIINALTDERVQRAIKKNIAPGELALTLIKEKPQE